MSNKHKNPTISFRISDYERREIEANIRASGMLKKTYFTRCCIYNRVCVVGKKETIYPLLEALRQMQEDMHLLYEEIKSEGQIREKTSPVEDAKYTDLEELQFDYMAMLKAVIRLLDGAKYLWQSEEKGKDGPADAGERNLT